MKGGRLSGALLIAFAAQAAAQTPQPFPKPGEITRPQPSSPAPQTPGVKVLPPDTRTQPPPAPAGEPTEQSLGMPIYPGAQFIGSYDAGRGQRYYLFGAPAEFLQVVTFYRTTLKQRGELVYEVPPIHMFDVGRFREETMAFPPGVTIKDYAWGGSPGYLNPKPGGQPAAFRTIVQIVPPPASPGVGK
jgi:hypothetical protein